MTVDSYDLDSLRLLTRQHREQRLREAERERLARELRVTGQRRPRPRLNIRLSHRLRQRAGQPRLEA
jgi:hypothetical protein